VKPFPRVAWFIRSPRPRAMNVGVSSRPEPWAQPQYLAGDKAFSAQKLSTVLLNKIKCLRLIAKHV
jgi:hypothetical protein